MAELSLKQIEDKLNQEFSKEERQIVFWYDSLGDFSEEVDLLNLENAKIHKLNKSNYFKTKVLLEREDGFSNYLVYADFEKPKARDNHLADTICYSKEFYADRVSLIASELNLSDKLKPIIAEHIKFFSNKERVRRIYNFEILNFDKRKLEVALMAATLRSEKADFDEILKLVLGDGSLLSNNKSLAELEKYNLLSVFWDHGKAHFSYGDEDPSLTKLVYGLFMTYLGRELKKELPRRLKGYKFSNFGSAMAFMDQFRNDKDYEKIFWELSDDVYRDLKISKALRDFSIEDYLDIDIFKDIDKLIIKWLVDRLVDENLNINVNGLSISEITEYREKKYFSKRFISDYHVVKHGFHIIKNLDFLPNDDLGELVDSYVTEDYKIDTHYRRFHLNLDRVKDKNVFEEIIGKVENIYINKFLNPIIKNFTKGSSYKSLAGKYKFQHEFYRNFVSDRSDNLVVFISDAFRYEVAQEMVKKMNREKRYESISIEPQIGMIPSITSLGMAALLPHSKLELGENLSVKVDGRSSRSLDDRRRILQSVRSDIDCNNYDTLRAMSRDELREFFKGKNIVYIYHDQIDARGDNKPTENEVFKACQDAIEEIMYLVNRLTTNVSRTEFIITADHGFIYKSSKTEEFDKIDMESGNYIINKRFVISDESISNVPGTECIFDDIVTAHGDYYATVPVSSSVYKSPGGGTNYVHGGSSPQELLVPVVKVKTQTSRVISENVGLQLFRSKKILNTYSNKLTFMQQDAISDIVHPASFKIGFYDDSGKSISNEHIYRADSRSHSPNDRIFELDFELRNQQYLKNTDYFLIAEDMETGFIAIEMGFEIDIMYK